VYIVLSDWAFSSLIEYIVPSQ